MGSVSKESQLSTQVITQVLCTQGDGSGTVSQITAKKTVASATTAAPVVCTSVAHGFVTGDYIFTEGATGTTEINGLKKVVRLTDDTYSLTTPAGVQIDSTGTFGGTVTNQLCFVYAPTSTAIIHRVLGYAYDTNYAANKYFDDTALTTGMELIWFRDDTELETLTAAPVQVWLDWALNAGVDIGTSAAGVGTATQAALRWSFDKAMGQLRIDGTKNESLVLVMRNTLAIAEQKMSIQGHF